MVDLKPQEQHGKQEEKERYKRTPYLILLFTVGIVIFFFGLWWILDWYINPQNSTQKKDLVQALGLITAGVAGAVGIVFTWRGQRLSREVQEDNQKAHEDNQRTALEQLEQTRNELAIQREGQITERFAQAIDQLGRNDETGEKLLEIRLGGIYALERIASDSERDHGPIMEVLTAYVRQHSPRESTGDASKDWAEEGEREDQGTAARPSDNHIKIPDTDIQAIITVIRRLTRRYGNEEHEHIDLHSTNLRGTNLNGADLRGAHLWGADLTGADLVEVDLQGADLREAHLGADLRADPGAELRGADLTGAHLQGVYFQRAYLGTDFTAAHPLTVNRLGMYVRRTLLAANLTGADLTGADLTGADLGANLAEEDLQAEYFGANLREAILRNADLVAANLTGANLTGADLRGARLPRAQGLTQEQLESCAIGDGETLLSNHLEAPSSWSRG